MNYSILEAQLYSEISEHPLLACLERALTDLRKEPSVEDLQKICISAFELVEFTLQELAEHSGVPIDKARKIVPKIPMFERAVQKGSRESQENERWCLTLNGVVETLEHMKILSSDLAHERSGGHFITPLDAARELLSGINRDWPSDADKIMAIEKSMIQLRVSRNHIKSIIKGGNKREKLFLSELAEISNVEDALRTQLESCVSRDD